MNKDEFVTAYLSEQLKEVVENLLIYTIDGKKVTKEEMDQYIKGIIEAEKNVNNEEVFFDDTKTE